MRIKAGEVMGEGPGAVGSLEKRPELSTLALSLSLPFFTPTGVSKLTLSYGGSILSGRCSWTFRMESWEGPGQIVATTAPAGCRYAASAKHMHKTLMGFHCSASHI